MTSSTLASDQEQACSEALDVCTIVVQKGQTAMKDQQALIDLQKKQREELAKALVDERQAKDSLIRNPFLWLFVGGLMGGIAVGLSVHK